MMINQSDAERLLTPLADMLRADGYAMSVRLLPDNDVSIAVMATGDACADCLIPSTLMKEIAYDALSAVPSGSFEGNVTIQYPSSADT